MLMGLLCGIGDLKFFYNFVLTKTFNLLIMIYLLIFFLAIVLANLSVFWFGPISTIFNAFFLVGLDLTIRDKLHETWRNRNLGLKMLLLISAGSVITFILNRDTLQIAFASVVAFSLATLVDTIIYSLLIKRKFLIKANTSNLGSAFADSIAFPTIAFGGFLPIIIIGQFAAKVLGGFLWSLLINHIKERKIAFINSR